MAFKVILKQSIEDANLLLHFSNSACNEASSISGKRGFSVSQQHSTTNGETEAKRSKNDNKENQTIVTRSIPLGTQQNETMNIPEVGNIVTAEYISGNDTTRMQNVIAHDIALATSRINAYHSSRNTEQLDENSEEYKQQQKEKVSNYMRITRIVGCKDGNVGPTEIKEINEFIKSIEDFTQTIKPIDTYIINLNYTLIAYAKAMINRDDLTCKYIISKLQNMCKYKGKISTNPRLDATRITTHAQEFIGDPQTSICCLYVEVIGKNGVKYFNIKVDDNKTYAFNSSGSHVSYYTKPLFLNNHNVINWSMNSVKREHTRGQGARTNPKISSNPNLDFKINLGEQPSNDMKTLRAAIKLHHLAGQQHVYNKRLYNNDYNSMNGARVNAYVMTKRRFFTHIINGFVPHGFVFAVDFRDGEIEPYLVSK